MSNFTSLIQDMTIKVFENSAIFHLSFNNQSPTLVFSTFPKIRIWEVNSGSKRKIKELLYFPKLNAWFILAFLNKHILYFCLISVLENLLNSPSSRIYLSNSDFRESEEHPHDSESENEWRIRILEEVPKSLLWLGNQIKRTWALVYFQITYLRRSEIPTIVNEW